MTTTADQGTATSDIDVEFRAVTKRFGSLVAVNAVNLRVHKGEFLSLLGAPLARPPEPVLAAMRARDGREPDWLARAPEPRGVMPDPAETGEEDQLSFRI